MTPPSHTDWRCCMRISDDKRREVAAKLRDNLGYMRDHEKWYEHDLDSEKCGNRAYRNIAVSVEKCGNFIDGNYIHIVETLADLIDRPTCHMEGTSRSGFHCSACGEQIPPMRIFCRDSAGDHWVPMEHNRCPMCGAEVVSNG